LPSPVTARTPPTFRAFYREMLAAALFSLNLLLAPGESVLANDLPLSPENLDAPHRLAIVIDDVGYSLERAEEIMALPTELTLGMLPYAPHALEIAERAHANGREIILHQPMESLTARRLEPGTLALDMTPEHFAAQFEAALERLPHVTGVNNHTGSLLTAHRLPMEQLMTGIARRGLFFLDSRTTPHTVAESTARELDVPTIRRDVFLDHVRSEQHLASAFDRGLAIARDRGQAVVIAHPYPITVAFLEQRLADLPEDVTLSTLSDLVKQPEVRIRRRGGIALLGSPASPHISPGL
jgi:polysaccharide deacetylase 2 family uncharacterized protein YibQ